jgi:replicative DNA helicase
MTTRELTLPQDVEAERSLVALLCEDWQPEAAHILPRHCYDPLARAVVTCARALHSRTVPVNLETLNGELRARDLIGEGKPVGSIADVSECANHLAMNETGATLAARIYTAWERRKAIRAAAVLADAAYNDNPATWLSSLARVVRALSPSEPLTAHANTAWRPTVQSARELMGKQLAPVRWVVEGLIAEGVTLLAAKPKKGKTVLMQNISMSVSGGTKALGTLNTQQGGVLYLALEDNERRMQRRLWKMLGPHETIPDGLNLVYEWPPLDRGGLDALHTYLDEHHEVILVVVDILERVRPRRSNGGNIYADDYAATRELQRLAGERQIAIVVIHHLRKGGAEDPMDEVSSSTGLTGGVDNILVMRPANGFTELARRGRDYEDDTPLALRGDRGRLVWTLEGSAEEVGRSRERRDVLDALRKVPGGLTPKELGEALNKKDGATRKLLFDMKQAGEVIKQDDGHYIASSGNGGNGGNTGNDGNASNGDADEVEDRPLHVRHVTPITPVPTVTPVTDVTESDDGSIPSSFYGRYHAVWESRFEELQEQGVPKQEALYRAVNEQKGSA